MAAVCRFGEPTEFWHLSRFFFLRLVGRETKYLTKSLTSLLSLCGTGHAETGGNTALSTHSQLHHSIIPTFPRSAAALFCHQLPVFCWILSKMSRVSLRTDTCLSSVQNPQTSTASTCVVMVFDAKLTLNLLRKRVVVRLLPFFSCSNQYY